MNGHRISLAVFSICLAATAAFAEENPAVSRIADNIQNLGHAKFHIRQQAALELTAIGEPALKSLRAASTSSDEEIRDRAQLIVRIIETRLRNDAFIRAPKLRLKYDNKPIQEAVADAAQKTGLAFVLDANAGSGPKQRVTVDTGDAPYWEAVEKFLAAAGLAEFVDKTPPPKQDPNIARMNAMRAQQALARATTPQPIRLIEGKSSESAATRSIVRVKVLAPDFPGSGIIKGSNEIKLFLDVTPAPTLAWHGNATAEIRKAVDDRGFSLAQSHLNGSDLAYEALNGDELQIIQMQNFQVGGRVVFNDGSFSSKPIGNPRHVPVTFLGREQHSRMLKELEGVVAAQVWTAPEALLIVENLQTASTKDAVRKGIYKIQITDRKMDKAGYLQLRFRLEMPVANEPFGRRADASGGDPAILFKDSNGKTIQNPSLNIIEMTSDGKMQSADYLAVIPTRGNPNNSVKFELSGRKLISVEIPFKLKNVPLP